MRRSRLLATWLWNDQVLAGQPARIKRTTLPALPGDIVTHEPETDLHAFDDYVHGGTTHVIVSGDIKSGKTAFISAYERYARSTGSDAVLGSQVTFSESRDCTPGLQLVDRYPMPHVTSVTSPLVGSSFAEERRRD